MFLNLTSEQIEDLKVKLRDEVLQDYGFNNTNSNLCKTCRKTNICNPFRNYGVVAIVCKKYIKKAE